MKYKQVIIFIIILITIGLITLFFLNSKPNQAPPSTLNSQNKSIVTIDTNENSYNKGEDINIRIRNGLKQDIFYYPGGDRFWNIEYYENEKWNRFGYEGREGFQISDKEVGNECYIALYEQVLPETLESGDELVTNCNQVICPFGEEYSKPSIVQRIEKGNYRLSFSYGFELNEYGDFIIEPKIIYSNIFTIE
jgi:hypothetical protein